MQDLAELVVLDVRHTLQIYLLVLSRCRKSCCTALAEAGRLRPAEDETWR